MWWRGTLEVGIDNMVAQVERLDAPNTFAPTMDQQMDNGFYGRLIAGVNLRTGKRGVFPSAYATDLSFLAVQGKWTKILGDAQNSKLQLVHHILWDKLKKI